MVNVNNNRGVFRALSNVHDGALLKKIVKYVSKIFWDYHFLPSDTHMYVSGG